MNNFQEKAKLIWDIAETLRGEYKQSDYGKVILPLTVLRRLDCVLEGTKDKVLEQLPRLQQMNVQNLEPVINRLTGESFHNISKFTFPKLLADPANILANVTNYINGYSSNARDIIDYFKFTDQLDFLDESNLLYRVISRFATVDLHPDRVSNLEMGYIFEELIRRFAEQSNETAGEHFTPREVIRLMVNILFAEDSDALRTRGIVRTLYDPACGTGGMLSVAQEYLKELNPDARLEVFGQELNPESYAICKSDMLVKGQNPSNIKFGNSFSKDGLESEKFDYMLSNPPFGVEWKKVQDDIENEHNKKGYAGRFGAGLPRINDGSLLFLQHMVSKMKAEGSRIGIVFNGSPLFTGAAESGESNIRRWIIENDWLEAIVALPDQLFYNTGISTYIWIVNNRKSVNRKGKIQLINAVGFSEKMRKSLGNKRNQVADQQISEVTRIYGEFQEGEFCKIFDNEDFGYHRITVERPLRLNFQVSEERIGRLQQETAFASLAKSKKKGEVALREIEEGQKLQQQILNVLVSMDGTVLYKNREEFVKFLKKSFKAENVAVAAPQMKAVLSALSERDETAEICRDAKANPEPDTELRDYENVPLKEDIQDYFEREVLPHVSDAWIDHSKTKVGYEIPFTRHFYEYQSLRPLEEIDAEIQTLEAEILDLLKGVTA
ncbi:type I restriction-modification system subunit M [Paenibacillus sp. TRM 82003]|nr:type I restriction-modification system subunit M [Paenibacillus sp. TRM 82003]